MTTHYSAPDVSRLIEAAESVCKRRPNTVLRISHTNFTEPFGVFAGVEYVRYTGEYKASGTAAGEAAKEPCGIGTYVSQVPKIRCARTAAAQVGIEKPARYYMA